MEVNKGKRPSLYSDKHGDVKIKFTDNLAVINVQRVNISTCHQNRSCMLIDCLTDCQLRLHQAQGFMLITSKGTTHMHEIFTRVAFPSPNLEESHHQFCLQKLQRPNSTY